MDKQKQCLLSIIVPVYNVEQYLERCVDSLVDQSLNIDEYEIIMVNDGSTDNSEMVAERLVAKYPVIHLYSQENRGLAGARNTGIRYSKGKYILFVDSDDYLVPNSIKPILDLSEKLNLEVCSFLLKVYREDGSFFYGSEHSFPKNEIFEGLFLVRHNIKPSSVCCGLYLRSFLERKNLLFHEGITHEDVEFSSRLFLHVTRIMFVENAPYVYFWNETSLNRSQDKEKKKKAFLDDVNVVGLNLNYVKDNNFPRDIIELYERRANSLTISKFIFLLRNKIARKEYGDFFLKRIKEFGLYPIKGGTLSWKTKMLIPIFNNQIFLKAIGVKNLEYYGTY